MKRILLISALAWSAISLGQIAPKNDYTFSGHKAGIESLKFGNDIQITSSGRIIIR